MSKKFRACTLGAKLKIFDALRRSPSVTHATYRLACTLLLKFHGNETGQLNPCLRKLARESAINKETVSVGLRALKSTGLIWFETDEETKNRGGFNRRNEYALNEKFHLMSEEQRLDWAQRMETTYPTTVGSPDTTATAQGSAHPSLKGRVTRHSRVGSPDTHISTQLSTQLSTHSRSGVFFGLCTAGRGRGSEIGEVVSSGEAERVCRRRKQGASPGKPCPWRASSLHRHVQRGGAPARPVRRRGNAGASKDHQLAHAPTWVGWMLPRPASPHPVEFLPWPVS